MAARRGEGEGLSCSPRVTPLLYKWEVQYGELYRARMMLSVDHRSTLKPAMTISSNE
jgi:hypothetical protein|eukprot:jgi/Botrbrau1/19078/Bobra.0427s0002.1